MPRGHLASGVLAIAARNTRTISPRIRTAARLYSSGAVPTKKAAAKAAGINEQWFSTMTVQNEATRRLVSDIDTQIHDQSVEMSVILRSIGREAISKIRTLMATSQSEPVALKAAIDLADRNPETSKVQRHEIVATQIAPEDAKALAAAMVRAAEVRAQYFEEAQGNIIRVNMEVTDGPIRQRDAQAEDARLEGPQGSDDEVEGEADLHAQTEGLEVEPEA